MVYNIIMKKKKFASSEYFSGGINDKFKEEREVNVKSKGVNTVKFPEEEDSIRKEYEFGSIDHKSDLLSIISRNAARIERRRK